MKMVHYRWPVEIVRAHFALQVLNSKSLESFFKILNRTVEILNLENSFRRAVCLRFAGRSQRGAAYRH